MKKVALVIALGLSSLGTAAFAQTPAAENQLQPVAQPVAMTDEQLDAVTAGALVQGGLINVDVNNVANNNAILNNNHVFVAIPVAVNVNAAAAIAALGGVAGAVACQVGC